MPNVNEGHIEAKEREPRRLKVGIRMGLHGCKIEDEIEVAEEASEEEIEQAVSEWALGRVDWWHEEIV